MRRATIRQTTTKEIWRTYWDNKRKENKVLNEIKKVNEYRNALIMRY